MADHLREAFAGETGSGPAADRSVAAEAPPRERSATEQQDGDLPEEWKTGTETRQEVDLHADGSYDIVEYEVDVYEHPDGYTLYVDPETGEILETQGLPDSWNTGTETLESVEFVDGSYQVVETEVDVYVDPDSGDIHYLDPETGEIVDSVWAKTPTYQGDVLIDGESYAVYEMPTGETYVIDGSGEIVSTLDDALDDIDTVDDPIWGEVYYVPAGPPSYDTIVHDAETGQPVMKINTGGDASGASLSPTHDADEQYSTYTPPGSDYVLIIDGDGNVVDQRELPPDEVWSIGGVVTYYDDGNLAIDVGSAQADIDLIGPEGGISFEVGQLSDITGDENSWLGGFGASVEWDEDGVGFSAQADISEFGHIAVEGEVGDDGFEFGVDIETTIPVDGIDISAGVSASVGVTEDGQFWLEGDVDTEFSIGALNFDASVNGYVEVGPEGFEVSGGWDGSVGMGPAFLEGGEQGSLALNSDGLTLTYDTYRGVGIDGIGSMRAGFEAQVQTDGTADGTQVTSGVYGELVDKEGESEGFIGGYATVGTDGVTSETRDERLDDGITRETYDRSHDAEPDTSGFPEDPHVGDTSPLVGDDHGAARGRDEPRRTDSDSDGTDGDRPAVGQRGAATRDDRAPRPSQPDSTESTGLTDPFDALPSSDHDNPERVTTEATPDHAPAPVEADQNADIDGVRTAPSGASPRLSADDDITAMPRVAGRMAPVDQEASSRIEPERNEPIRVEPERNEPSRTDAELADADLDRSDWIIIESDRLHPTLGQDGGEDSMAVAADPVGDAVMADSPLEDSLLPEAPPREPPHADIDVGDDAT